MEQTADKTKVTTSEKTVLRLGDALFALFKSAEIVFLLGAETFPNVYDTRINV